MKKIIGYVRVSSEMQKDKDNSIANQKKYIIDYCKRFEFELVDIYEDLAVSGLKDDRVGLNGLFDKINNVDIDGVVVYSLSRLGRKLTKVIDVIDSFSKKGIDFISIKENFNVNEIYGKLMLQILGSLNEFEVNVLGERIKDVKQYKKSINEVYCKQSLFGTYKRKGKLIRNNNELKTLKLIKKLREKNLYSYGRISDYLNDNNILSKNKGIWYGNSVRSVYNNGCIEKYKV